jgi:NitT/TauT family transport system ATP-binding protein
MLLDLWQEFRMTVVFITHDIDEAIFLSDRLVILTQRPGGIKAEIATGLKRPRNPELLTSPEFMLMKRECMELLREPKREPFRPAQNSTEESKLQVVA